MRHGAVPPKTIVAAAPITRSHPEPKILWPSTRYYGDNGGPDSSAFPSLPAIKARYAAKPPEALEAFIHAVLDARDRILILDDYLFKPQEGQSLQGRYEQILLWFPDGLTPNEIRLLTNAHQDQERIRQRFNERTREINQTCSPPHRCCNDRNQFLTRQSISLRTRSFCDYRQRAVALRSHGWGAS